ncbi:MAG: hypothetical protein NTY51_06130 [Deltaproteobacteria bacterium]|nr:hypothetical protein [Deltaproteobacteria bacterium]
MDSGKFAVLEQEILRLIDQNERFRREQDEKLDRELEKRDKRIGELDKAIRQIRSDNKAAKGKLDRIIEKLEAFT